MTVLVPAYVKDRSRSWPKHEDAPNVPYAPIEQLLLAHHPVDAHFSAYSCPEIPKRLSTHPPAYERIPGGTRMVLLVVDVDDPVAHETETSARPGWRFVEQEKAKTVLAAVPGFVYYETKGGYRLVGVLAQPVTISNDDDYRDWRTRYLCWLGWLSRTWGIAADPAMRDWTRAYRLPRVLRDGKPQDPPIWGTLGAINHPVELADLEEVKRLAAHDEAWKQALAGLGGAREERREYEPVEHGDRLDDLRRYAQKLIDDEPVGRAGSGGGTAMFLVCRKLYRGLALPDDDSTYAILMSYALRCDPPWEKEAEIKHKIESAKNTGSIALGAYLPRFEAWLALEKARDGLPVVRLGTDEDSAVNEVIGHLARLPDIFAHYQSCALADVIEQEQDMVAPGHDGIQRFGGAPRIRQLPSARVRTLTTKVSRFEKWDGRARDWAPCNPTEWLVSGVFAEGRWSAIRQIVGLGDSPVILGDGRVLHQRGYDEASGIYVTSRLPVDVPDRPGLAEARAAAGMLLDLIGQFEFASPAHRSTWLCALLTVLSRFAFSGPAPLFLFEASTAGSGKTLLADLLSCIAFGRPASRTPFSPHDEEMRKKITSAAMAGDRMILLDNVPNGGVLQSSALDAALTSNGWWKDRLLGTNDVYDGPLLAVFFATGNNLSIAGDLGRRIVHCRLEPSVDMPELRSGFRYPQLLQYVLQRRAAFVAAGLTVLKAHHWAGRPEMGLGPWGSFEGWSRTARAPLAWLGMADPGETRAEMQAMADKGRGAAATLVHELFRVFGPREFSSGDVSTTAYPKTFNLGGDHMPLREAIEELTNVKPGSSATSLQIGNSLKKIRGRVFDGLKLACKVDSHTKAMRWYVC